MKSNYSGIRTRQPSIAAGRRMPKKAESISAVEKRRAYSAMRSTGLASTEQTMSLRTGEHQQERPKRVTRFGCFAMARPECFLWLLSRARHI